MKRQPSGSDSASYVRSESTTWRLKLAKVARAPQAGKDSPPKAGRWRGFRRRDPAQWATVRLKFEPRSEAWVIVSARGQTNAYPADTYLLDLVLDINQAGW